jgi:hypothetical protein
MDANTKSNGAARRWTLNGIRAARLFRLYHHERERDPLTFLDPSAHARRVQRAEAGRRAPRRGPEATPRTAAHGLPGATH